MSRPSSEDELLVQKCKDELPYITRSFEQLLRKHEPSVFKTCQYLLSDPSDAEEACQDIFLRVFHKIHTFQQKASFRTWLKHSIRRNPLSLKSMKFYMNYPAKIGK